MKTSILCDRFLSLGDGHLKIFFFENKKIFIFDFQVGGSQVSEEEKKKLEKEFDEYWDKLQKAKES